VPHTGPKYFSEIFFASAIDSRQKIKYFHPVNCERLIFIIVSLTLGFGKS